MIYFVQTTKHDINMHTKFLCLKIHRFFNKFLQDLHSWNFIPHIMEKMVMWSYALCRSIHKDYKKI
jgi:hypothetical protein